ncbi:MAG: DUF445 family protein [Gemmatimonadota bacterium]
MSPDLVAALVTIAFGALAGGITNTVAIWMLFHPYEPPRVGRFRIGFLHGAVPKNQARLAAAIGRTVGERLLTEEDLAHILSAPEFRAAFDERLGAFLDSLLRVERGSLRSLLPDTMRPEMERLLREGVDHAVDRLQAHVQTDAFAEQVEDRAEDLYDRIRQEPLAELLTADRQTALAELSADWLRNATQGSTFRAAVREYLGRWSERLLTEERTFQEILPSGLVASVERAVAGYLPLAIQRLGRLLEDPVTRLRFQRVVHDLLRRFMQDLKFHQRVVAKLLMTDEAVDRVLGTIEREGAERLSEMLREPEMQQAMSKGVNDAFVDLLGRPVRSVLGSPGDDSVEQAIETLCDWIVRMVEDPRTRQFLVERLGLALEGLSERTWGDLLGRVPPERFAGWLVEAARTESALRLSREGLHRVASHLLDRPLGRPHDWFPDDAITRIEPALGSALWAWVQTQIPEVVHRIEVSRRVEEKVLAFPTPKMEEIVRRVTERELRLIVKLGYLLGAIVGLVLVGVNALLPRLGDLLR